MALEWMQKLVDPLDREPLRPEGIDFLISSNGTRYPIIDGVPIFFQAEFEDGSYNPNLTDEPLPPHIYYERYFDNLQLETLLDLGSGDAVMSARIAPYVKELFCVNPGLQALRIALKRKIGNLRPVCAIAPDIPFADGYFDAVMTIFVIEHIARNETSDFFACIRRVLKPNGFLLISTDTLWYDRYIRKWWETVNSIRRGKFEMSKHVSNSTHVNLMTPGQLRDILIREGFVIEREDLFPILGRTFRKLPRRIAEDFATSMFVFKARMCRENLLY
jgi:SAM-dependent methyltransferase